VPGKVEIEGRAGIAASGLIPTGLSQDIHLKRSGFLNPAASSAMASSFFTVMGAVLALSNFLSEEEEEGRKERREEEGRRKERGRRKGEQLTQWLCIPAVVEGSPTKVGFQGLQLQAIQLPLHIIC